MDIVEWHFDARRYYPLDYVYAHKKYPYIEIRTSVHFADGRIYHNTALLGERAYKTEGVFDSYMAFLFEEIVTDLKAEPDQPRY